MPNVFCCHLCTLVKCLMCFLCWDKVILCTVCLPFGWMLSTTLLIACSTCWGSLFRLPLSGMIFSLDAWGRRTTSLKFRGGTFNPYDCQSKSVSFAFFDEESPSQLVEVLYVQVEGYAQTSNLALVQFGGGLGLITIK